MIGVGAAFDFLAGTKNRLRFGCVAVVLSGFFVFAVNQRDYGNDIP